NPEGRIHLTFQNHLRTLIADSQTQSKVFCKLISEGCIKAGNLQVAVGGEITAHTVSAVISGQTEGTIQTQAESESIIDRVRIVGIGNDTGLVRPAFDPIGIWGPISEFGFGKYEIGAQRNMTTFQLTDTCRIKVNTGGIHDVRCCTCNSITQTRTALLKQLK